MVGDKKVDTVVIGLEDGSYIKLTGEYAELFSRVSSLYRPLLAVANASNKKEGEAYFNDGQSIKPLSEVI